MENYIYCVSNYKVMDVNDTTRLDKTNGVKMNWYTTRIFIIDGIHHHEHNRYYYRYEDACRYFNDLANDALYELGCKGIFIDDSITQFIKKVKNNKIRYRNDNDIRHPRSFTIENYKDETCKEQKEFRKILIRKIQIR